jgi:hypothetical protein
MLAVGSSSSSLISLTGIAARQQREGDQALYGIYVVRGLRFHKQREYFNKSHMIIINFRSERKSVGL